MDDTSILPRAFGAIKAFEPLHPPPASGPASRRLTRPPPLYVYPLPDNAGGQPQLSSHGFARRPSAATGTSTPLQASPVSLVPGATDSESICSGSCSGCCEEEACKDECLESCAGFIDCDDAELCTSPDCVEVGCLDDAPPCFDKDCVPHLTAAANLAAPSLLRHDQFSPQSILPRTGLPQLDMMAFSPQSEPASATTASSSHLDFFDPSFANRYASGIVNAPMAKGPRGILSCGYDYTAAGGSNMSTRSPVRPSHAPEDTSMPVDYVGDALHSQWGGNCGGEFFDWNALDEHILSNHVKPQNEVQCRWDDCQRATDPSSLTTHVLNDHQPSLQGMQQACRWSQCTLTVPGPEELVSHLRTTHMPANALHCQWDLCGALADDASDLLAHLQTDHLLDPAAVSTKMSGEMGLLPEATSASAPRKCRWDHVSKAGSECGQICADAISLQQHIKEVHISHLNKQLGFVCKWAECRRRTSGSFGQKGKLERHIQVHTGFKSCRCEICGRELSGLLALQQHKRLHTGERPFKCETCGKAFAQGTALTMHIRTHTREKPLKCDFPGCDKTFRESSTLSKHKKTHNTVEQYKCQYLGCNSAFHRLDQRKRHYKLIHGGPPGLDQGDSEAQGNI